MREETGDTIMTDHQLILKMIEEVSPDDTAQLDEIDARVWCWINGKEYIKKDGLDCWFDDSKCWPWKARWLVNYLEDKNWQYTRSRDALKAIRPEGWYITIDEYEKTTATLTEFAGGFRQVVSPWLPTENLAELHAIIQAIAHDRLTPH